MTMYVTSPNFNILIVVINFLLAKNHRENILQRTIYIVSRERKLVDSLAVVENLRGKCKEEFILSFSESVHPIVPQKKNPH